MKLWRLRQFCCGCSLQTGTKLVGVLCLIIGIGGFIKDLIDSARNEENVIDSVPEIIGSSLTIATSIFVLVSAWKNGKPMYLMPWLVLQAASLFAAIGYSLYSGIILSRAHQKVEVITGYFIGCFIGAAIWFSFWLVVYSYYLELKEKANPKINKLPSSEEKIQTTDYQIIAITDEPIRRNEEDIVISRTKLIAVD